MKIGLDKAPASPAGTYSQHLAKVLSKHAPGHEYIELGGHYHDIDLYHGFRPSLPLAVRLRRVPSVVTVRDLNFLRYPQLWPLSQRLFVLGSYRRALRAASRLIALSSEAREELAERLDIDRRRIEVVTPLAALAPQSPPEQARLEAVRRKYELPEQFVLMLGTVEPRHNHEAVFEALFLDESDRGVGAVVCGRRTAYSAHLLQFARERHMAARVDFLYEIDVADLAALFRLARVFVYISDADAEASIIPVVEALRAELPMILSDTQCHREAAGDAAVYVNPGSAGELAAALENALGDEDFRLQMQSRERRRAELFSEYAVAQRLMDIYSSL